MLDSRSLQSVAYVIGPHVLRPGAHKHQIWGLGRHPCFSHNLQPTSERSERPTTSANGGVTLRLRGMTHWLFCASCLAYPCVINRAVSMSYPICTPLPPCSRKARPTSSSP